MEAAEGGLRRLEGVESAKAQGFRSPEKFFYDLVVKEGKAVTPAQVLDFVKKTDYEFVELVYKKLPGTVEKGVFTARSGQKYALKAGGPHEKLIAEGKARLAVSGKVTQPEKGDLLIEVTEAVELK